MLSDKKHITWKLIYFCIDACKELFNIEDASRVIGSFLINPYGKNSPALRAWFTSSKIFHAVRARITVYFKLRTRLPIFLLSEHENPALTAWKILLEVILLWGQDFFFSAQLKCFDFSQTFHGLLLSLQKKIEMKIFTNQSQESLKKSSWISIAMLCCRLISFAKTQLKNYKITCFLVCSFFSSWLADHWPIFRLFLRMLSTVIIPSLKLT
jgi:hypothetical protein